MQFIKKEYLSVAIAFLCGFVLAILSFNSKTNFVRTPIRQVYNEEKIFSHSHTSPSVHDACGNWQQSYINLHKSILNGSRPPRYLVSVAVEAGFADRMTGTLTGFMFALLTNRAYQIITYGTLPRFEAAFAAPNINWSRATDPDKLINNLKYTYRGVRGFHGDRSYGPDVDTKLYWPIYLINDEKGNSFYSHDNVSNYPINHADVQTVFMASNRGRIIRLFDNPYHRSTLLRMGLRPDITPRCLWKFLFSPTEAVNRAMNKEFQALSSTEPLKIAINIRVGDHVFSPEGDQKTTLEPYEHYFKCASEIESFARAQDQTIIWYVTSDSLQLRKLAKQRYADKVLTQDVIRYVHGDCGDIPEKRYGNCSAESQDLSIVMAAGQAIAMSMCDFIITPDMSGFGMVASWLRGPWHNIFRLGSTPRACTQDNYESLEALSSSGAGM